MRNFLYNKRLYKREKTQRKNQTTITEDYVFKNKITLGYIKKKHNGHINHNIGSLIKVKVTVLRKRVTKKRFPKYQSR